MTILKMLIIRIRHIKCIFMCIILLICLTSMTTMPIIALIAITANCFVIGWFESVGSRVVYDLDYKKPILYVVSI